MKFIFGLLVLATVCFGVKELTSERYVEVAEYVQDKTVMIEVPTIAKKIFFRIEDSKLSVETATVPVTMYGSGVFVTPRGHILSCAHVIDHKLTSPIIATLSNGTTVAATVLYQDDDKDLALLKVEGEYPYADLEDDIRLGQEVIAVGNPQAQPFSTTHGIISHLDRDIGEFYTYTQTDAPINPGNSGGPLYNLDGKLIGINARKYANSDGLGLAVSAQTIREFLSLFRGLETLY